MHPELPAIAFLAAFSLLLILPWHWRTGGVSILAVIFWLFTMDIIYAVDAILWADNVDIKALVWCDINRIVFGGSIALPAAILCICIRLHKASSARSRPTDDSSNTRRIWTFEFCMCYILPAIFMVLLYIVENHRMVIEQFSGCNSSFYFSVPGIIIVLLPPIILSLIALGFAATALISIIRHYRFFTTNLTTSSPEFTLSHYVRLMLMALFEIIWTTTATVYILGYALYNFQLMPYTSWAAVHRGWSEPIPVLPASGFSGSSLRGQYAVWLLVPVSTFIFVVMFAFGQEPMEGYKRMFEWICAHLLPQCVSDKIMSRNSTVASLQFRHSQTAPGTISGSHGAFMSEGAVGTRPESRMVHDQAGMSTDKAEV